MRDSSSRKSSLGPPPAPIPLSLPPDGQLCSSGVAAKMLASQDGLQDRSILYSEHSCSMPGSQASGGCSRSDVCFRQSNAVSCRAMINCRMVLTTCAVLLLSAILAAQSKDNADQRAARKMSESFVSDLIANRVDTKSQFAQILDLCGRPQNRRIVDDGTPVMGDNIVDGQKRTTMQFLYLCKTARNSDQIFSVEVEKIGDGKYRISGLSCRKPNLSPPTSTQ
jgi:hypothetical protein